jgi:hypothetical protein
MYRQRGPVVLVEKVVVDLGSQGVEMGGVGRRGGNDISGAERHHGLAG